MAESDEKNWLDELFEVPATRKGEPDASDAAQDETLSFDYDAGSAWAEVAKDFERAPDPKAKADYSGPLMKYGRSGEKLVIAALKADGREVTDVTGDREWRRKAVDLLTPGKDGEQVRIEVKRDSKFISDGPFVEVGRVYHKCEPHRFWYQGWTVRSEAHWLVWVHVETRKLYRIKFADFRKAVQNYVEREREEVAVYVVPSNEDYSTIGFRIPWKEVEAMVQVIEVKAEVAS